MAYVLQRVKHVVQWFNGLSRRELLLLGSRLALATALVYLAIVYILPMMSQGAVTV